MTASDFQKLFKVIAENTSSRVEVLRVQADGEVVTMASGKYFRVRPDGVYMKPSWRSSKSTKVG